MIFMMLFRFLCGYISFTLKDGFTDDFINRCRAEKITLTNIKKENNSFICTTHRKNTEKIIQLSKDSASTLEYTEHGLPAFLTKNKSRMGFLIGGISGMLIIALLSSVVWSVEVKGNNKFTKEQILKICEINGVKKGAFTKSIDIKSVQDKIVSDYDDIMWFSVNIFGSKVVAEVMENIEKPEMFTSDTPCNIISSEDGELLSLDIDSGLSAINKGGAVTKGQLLISGVLNNLDGTVHYTHAKGSAKVRFNKILYSTVSENDSILGIKEISNRKSLYFFGITIPLGLEKKTGNKFTYKEYLSTDDSQLPIGIITDVCTKLIPDNTRLDTNRLLLLTGYTYFLNEKKENEKCEIVQKKLEYTSENGICTVYGKYTLIKDCALEQYFEVETVE